MIPGWTVTVHRFTSLPRCQHELYTQDQMNLLLGLWVIVILLLCMSLSLLNTDLPKQR